jgi:hypothetical protein
MMTGNTAAGKVTDYSPLKCCTFQSLYTDQRIRDFLGSVIIDDSVHLKNKLMRRFYAG